MIDMNKVRSFRMLDKIFDNSVKKWLKGEKKPKEKLAHRIAVVNGAISPRWSAVKKQGILACRRGWESYLRAADKCGLLDGEEGKELRKRLCSRNDDDFRSAMAECLVCWYFHMRLGLDIVPKPHGRDHKKLEMIVKHRECDVNVEVKAPLRETDAKVWWGNDSDALERCLREANKQFRKDVVNVLVIVPDLRTPVSVERNQLREAFFGKLVIRLPIGKSKHNKVEENKVVIKPTGRFV